MLNGQLATAKRFCSLFPCLLIIHSSLLAQDLCSRHLNMVHSADRENIERIYAAQFLFLSLSNIPAMSLQIWAPALHQVHVLLSPCVGASQGTFLWKEISHGTSTSYRGTKKSTGTQLSRLAGIPLVWHCGEPSKWREHQEHRNAQVVVVLPGPWNLALGHEFGHCFDIGANPSGETLPPS